MEAGEAPQVWQVQEPPPHGLPGGQGRLPGLPVIKRGTRGLKQVRCSLGAGVMGGP